MKTLEEFINDNGYPVWYSETSETEGETVINYQDCKQIAIEFAQMHVEAALKEALESIPCLGSSSDIATYEEVEDEVLNAYPLTNIK